MSNTSQVIDDTHALLARLSHLDGPRRRLQSELDHATAQPADDLVDLDPVLSATRDLQTALAEVGLELQKQVSP